MTSFSDTGQLSLLSGINTPVKSCANDPPKDGSPSCMCGKGTSDCSIHPSTPEKWIASMRDSLAKTLALLESRQAYLREPDQVFTEKSCVLLTSLDRDTCSWRTLQQSFLTDSEPFSQTWPRWGMTQGGYAYAHPMSGRRITVTDGSCWPTPCATDVKGSPTAERAAESSRGVRLPEEMTRRMFPTPLTPRANDSENTVGKYYATRKQHDLTSEVAMNGGQLNPDWVAWLMGFPIAWANSKATETRKSHSMQQSPGNSSEASE